MTKRYFRFTDEGGDTGPVFGWYFDGPTRLAVVDVPSLVRMARKCRGVTRRQLAKATGIDYERLYDFECDYERPTRHELRAILGDYA